MFRRTVFRRSLAATAVASLLLLTAACGDDGDAPATTPSSSDGATEPAATTVDITIADGEASTAGERVEVGVGEPVDLVISSDVAGELHVHSTPEQFLEFEAGENDPIGLVIDRPGVVEIELHEPTEGPVVELLVQ